MLIYHIKKIKKALSIKEWAYVIYVPTLRQMTFQSATFLITVHTHTTILYLDADYEKNIETLSNEITYVLNSEDEKGLLFLLQ